MSETTTAPTPNDVAEATVKGDEKVTETPDQTIEALRAALTKANKEAKDNRLKASELDQLKQAQMSELEKAQTAAQAAAAEAATAKAEALRWRIAAKHGISDEDAETFLTAGDEESLTRQAERLSAMAQSTTLTPKPDLTQGGQGGTPPALNSDALEEALRSKLGIL